MDNDLNCGVEYKAILDNGCIHTSMIMVRAKNANDARYQAEKHVAKRIDVKWVRATEVNWFSEENGGIK